MRGRTWVVAAMAAGLCVPVAALADHEETAWCMPAPVGTVGLHAEVGTEEVHVPALTDVALCVDVPQPVGQGSTPTEFTQYPGCGFPCFRVVIEEGRWTAASTRVSVYLRYEADGVPTVVPLANEPIWVGVDNPNPVCVSMGNPIPECPSYSIAVPIPGL